MPKKLLSSPSPGNVANVTYSIRMNNLVIHIMLILGTDFFNVKWKSNNFQY